LAPKYGDTRDFAFATKLFAIVFPTFLGVIGAPLCVNVFDSLSKHASP